MPATSYMNFEIDLKTNSLFFSSWRSFCVYRGDYDQELFAGIQIPIMVVGCKADQAQNLREKSPSGRSSVAEECGADEFNLVS